MGEKVVEHCSIHVKNKKLLQNFSLEFWERKTTGIPATKWGNNTKVYLVGGHWEKYGRT
jgi:hypothetical protein